LTHYTLKVSGVGIMILDAGYWILDSDDLISFIQHRASNIEYLLVRISIVACI